MKYNFKLKFDSLFDFASPSYDDRQIGYLLTEGQFRVFIKNYNPFGNKYKRGFEQNEKRRRDLEQLLRSAIISGSFTTGAGGFTGNVVSGSNLINSLNSIVGLVPGSTLLFEDGFGGDEVTIVSVANDTAIRVDTVATSSASSTNAEGGLGKSDSQGGVHPNGVFLDLPEGFLYAVEESVVTSLAPDQEVDVIPVPHDLYRENIRDPYKKPYKNLAWRMDFSREIHADGSTDQTSKRVEIIVAEGAELEYYRVRYLRTPPDIIVDEVTPENQIHCILDETLHREIVDEAVKIAAAAVNPEEYQIKQSEKNDSE